MGLYAADEAAVVDQLDGRVRERVRREGVDPQRDAAVVRRIQTSSISGSSRKGCNGPKPETRTTSSPTSAVGSVIATTAPVRLRSSCSRTTTSASIVSALALGGMLCLAHPGAANAQATDAVNGCGADVTGDGTTAYVPSANQLKRFERIYTSTLGYVELKCGNGTSWGAVHIELKHSVQNWADTATCIQKTIGRGKETEKPNGKTDYLYSFSGGSVLVTVGSVNGIVTAYPTGTTGIAKKWVLCSVS